MNLARLLKESIGGTRVDARPGLSANDGSEPEHADDPRLPAVIAALRTVHDPEIPLNIYDLGLIYGLDIDSDGVVRIAMTLTAPACPVAGTFPDLVEDVVRTVAGVSDAVVELVWEPAWSPQRMSEASRLQLGIFP